MNPSLKNQGSDSDYYTFESVKFKKGDGMQGRKQNSLANEDWARFVVI
jgi:hypothetical protein